jgi:hypothetical protein
LKLVGVVQVLHGSQGQISPPTKFENFVSMIRKTLVK